MRKMIACVALVMLFAGCSSPADRPESSEGEELRPASKPAITKNVIYFDFDSYGLRPEAQAVLQAWAKHLNSNPARKLRLEGHADERGSREYNVGLGERRADSVREALIALGAGEAQLRVISYGEERPVAAGHSEKAWSRNRRVEIIED